MATTNYSWNLPTVGGSEDTWGTSLNANWTALDTLLGGVTNTEFAILDGATITTTELNYLSGAQSNLQSQIDTIVASGGANNNTITIAGSTGLSGGGSFTLNQAFNETITVTGVTQAQSAWETGTSTTEGVVSPAKIKAAIDAVGGGLGIGQTWQSVSRAFGTSYTNSTGKPIMVNVRGTSANNTYSDLTATVGGVSFVIAADQTSSSTQVVGNFVVPNGATYSVSGINSGLSAWHELR